MSRPRGRADEPRQVADWGDPGHSTALAGNRGRRPSCGNSRRLWPPCIAFRFRRSGQRCGCVRRATRSPGSPGSGSCGPDGWEPAGAPADDRPTNGDPHVWDVGLVHRTCRIREKGDWGTSGTCWPASSSRAFGTVPNANRHIEPRSQRSGQARWWNARTAPRVTWPASDQSISTRQTISTPSLAECV